MIPQVISLKLDRRIARAGITLAQIVDAFVAQLSTRASNESMGLIVALNRVAARPERKKAAAKRPGIASKSPRPRAKARLAT